MKSDIRIKYFKVFSSIKMPDYSNGKIYCIRNRADDDKIVYVGSTVDTLSRRMVGHRSFAKNPKFSNWKIYQLFNSHGIEQFYIELIKLYPCNCKDELCAEEGQYIRQFKTNEIGNKKIEGRTKGEWYIDNSAKILEQRKQYRADNANKIKEKEKIFRANNAEKIKEYQRQYRLRKKAENSAQ